MTDTATKRHTWTKDELTHLNRTVSHSKKKSEAFEKIAQEMGMTKAQVAATYYNHRPKSDKPAVKKGPGRPRKSIAKAMPTASSSSSSGAWYVAFQQGRPYDFQSLSEAELIEALQGIKAEVARRQDILNEASSFLV